MKIRESGMPQESAWNGFFNPSEILKTIGVTSQIKDIAEFGCGYGTFTIPTARLVNGRVYAIDIEPEMIDIVKKKAEENRLANITIMRRDFLTQGSGLKDASVDYAMLFNILHLEEPINLLKEAYRILRPGGKVGIIHWNYDPPTQRGPPMEIRPKPEQCIEWAVGLGFSNPVRYDLKPYHYGIVGVKE